MIYLWSNSSNAARLSEEDEKCVEAVKKKIKELLK